MYKCDKCGAPTRPNVDGDIRYAPVVAAPPVVQDAAQGEREPISDSELAHMLVAAELDPTIPKLRDEDMVAICEARNWSVDSQPAFRDIAHAFFFEGSKAQRAISGAAHGWQEFEQWFLKAYPQTSAKREMGYCDNAGNLMYTAASRAWKAALSRPNAPAQPAPYKSIENNDLPVKSQLQPASPVLQGERDYETVMRVAIKLAEMDGNDDPHTLIWEGGPIPEPWGEVWCKYEPDAKAIVDIVLQARASSTAAIDKVPEGWRPIETAPRDSSRVLIAFKTYEGEWRVREAWWRLPYDGARDDRCWWCVDKDGTVLDASIHKLGAEYWMQIPAAPLQSADKEKP